MEDRSMSAHRFDTGTDLVRAEVRDGVGLVLLNRPERRNALHQDMFAAVRATIREFVRSDAVRCLVFTGSGTAFCAGGDVRDGSGRSNDERPDLETAAAKLLSDAQLTQEIHQCPKPTVAAVNGPAVGAGLSIALATDFRVLAPSAVLLGGWRRLAFSGDFGAAWLLTQLVGASRALELLARDRPLTAEEAHAWGLANHVTSEAFEDDWRDWIRPISEGPLAATISMKANVRQAQTASLEDALMDESRRMVRSATTREHRIAVRAWLDGVAPDFGDA